MNILEHYYLFAASLQYNKNPDSVDHQFALIKKLFNRSTAYAFDCTNYRRIIDEYVDKAEIDTNTCDFTLPHPYMYIGFDDSFTLYKQRYTLTGILVSKGTIIMLLFDGSAFTTTILYKDGVRVADTANTSDMFLCISAIIDCINKYPHTLVNRKTNKDYSRLESKYNKKGRLRILPFYYQVSSTAQSAHIPRKHPVVIDYLHLCLSVNASEDKEELKSLADALDAARVYELSHEKFQAFSTSIQYEQFVDDLKAKFANVSDADRYIVDTFRFSDLEPPHPYMYIGFIDPPGFMTGSRRDLMQGFILSDTAIYMNALHTDTKQLYTFRVYRDCTWQIDDNASIANTLLFIKVLLLYINSFNTVVVNQSTDRSFNRTCETVNIANHVRNPPCYYTVGLKRNVKVDAVKILNKLRRECTYAYDVRGHRVHRIHIGTLPIDPKTEVYLKKDERRKIFYSPEDIDKDTRALLTERGYDIQEGEWVSVLVVQRKGHIANLKGGKNPYIPSVHTD